MVEQVDAVQISNLLKGWVERELGSDMFSWVDDRLNEIGKGDRKDLFLAFGLASRKVGKQDLLLTEEDLGKADQLRAGWQPVYWTIDQAVRTLFILSFPSSSALEQLTTLDQMFASGEVRELVALYQMLPLFPNPEQHALRAAEGVRSNMKSVFCAVAHYNVFPSEQFQEVAWNQMVLKSLFIEAPLAPIVGLDARANPMLARMLCDYAHERWAAGRKVSPELWRCVGTHADEKGIADLKRVFLKGDEAEQRAAALSLFQSPQKEARGILKEHPELFKEVEEGKISWEQFMKN